MKEDALYVLNRNTDTLTVYSSVVFQGFNNFGKDYIYTEV